jgi:hypothetical protein
VAALGSTKPMDFGKSCCCGAKNLNSFVRPGKWHLRPDTTNSTRRADSREQQQPGQQMPETERAHLRITVRAGSHASANRLPVAL